MSQRTLTRAHSVRERIGDSLSSHPNELVALFSRFANISHVLFSLCEKCWSFLMDVVVVHACLDCLKESNSLVGYRFPWILNLKFSSSSKLPTDHPPISSHPVDNYPLNLSSTFVITWSMVADHCSSYDLVIIWLFAEVIPVYASSSGRFVHQGKGMLQPHQLLAEYGAVFSEADREKLKDGAFEDVIQAAQV